MPVKRVTLAALVGLTLLAPGACVPSAAPEANPFLTYTETFGVPAEGAAAAAAARGATLRAAFRQPVTLVLQNNHPTADLDFWLAAWVNVSSVRTAQQQAELLDGGYAQLRREVRLGNAFTLPVGTFVYNGSGVAGATAVHLGPAQPRGPGDAPATATFSLPTPDVILFFYAPPVSCDSIAFVYSDNGLPLPEVPAGGPLAPNQGSVRGAGFKTLAMISAYQCYPFRPGLFLKTGGGAQAANEYVEGDTITVSFNQTADANGYFAIVSIGASAPTSP